MATLPPNQDAALDVPPSDPSPNPVPRSRLQLVWDVLTFQVKLAVDGLRDVILIPISLAAGLLGLLIGGDNPGKYYDQVLRLGRRSEYWINLFGYRKGKGTADDVLRPIQERVFEEAERNPMLNKAGDTIIAPWTRSVKVCRTQLNPAKLTIPHVTMAGHQVALNWLALTSNSRSEIWQTK